MSNKVLSEKEFKKIAREEKIANWTDQIDAYRKEIRDICARIGIGEIEIGSSEFTLSMEIVDGNACRIDAYKGLIESEKKKK